MVLSAICCSGIQEHANTDKYRSALQDLRAFWKFKIRIPYEQKQLKGRGSPILGRVGELFGIYRNVDFFGHHWAGRSEEFRLLSEPLDIVNWYVLGKHQASGHYINGTESESGQIGQVDNRKRPGIYLFLQNKEEQVFGKAPKNSLEKASSLKQHMDQISLDASLQPKLTNDLLAQLYP